MSGSRPTHAGRLLLATPALSDPSFLRAVVLLLDHDADGALGVILNRPSEVTVSTILPRWQDYATGPGVVFRGGPVALDSALGLAAVTGGDEPIGFRWVPAVPRPQGRLGLVDLDAPAEVVGTGLAGLRIFAGYAGWSPGQLEDEVDSGAWYVVDADPGDPFDPAPDQLWRRVLRRQSGDLALVSTWVKDASQN